LLHRQVARFLPPLPPKQSSARTSGKYIP
jgi:hypothetical protein